MGESAERGCRARGNPSRERGGETSIGAEQQAGTGEGGTALKGKVNLAVWLTSAYAARVCPQETRTPGPDKRLGDGEFQYGSHNTYSGQKSLSLCWAVLCFSGILSPPLPTPCVFAPASLLSWYPTRVTRGGGGGSYVT